MEGEGEVMARNCIIIVFLWMVFFIVSGGAQAFVVDGDLSDWGVYPGGFGFSDWQPDSEIAYLVEDQSGERGAYLGPGYGGQLYDAEAMYFAFEGDYAYIAVVTGVSPSGSGYRTPGDIFIDFGNDGSYEYGIRTIGTHQGDVYTNLSLIPTEVYPVSSPARLNISGSDFAGHTDVVYKKGAKAKDPLYTNNWYHYIIEARLPLELFAQGGILAGLWSYPFRIHWTMKCGNDALDLVLVPEPATVLLFLLGIMGIARLGGVKE